jgi:hypothetical protein
LRGDSLDRRSDRDASVADPAPLLVRDGSGQAARRLTAAIDDSDGYAGSGLDPMHDPVDPLPRAEMDVGVDPDALEVLGNRPPGRRVSGRLRLRASGSRARVGAPAVENPGNVDDPIA